MVKKLTRAMIGMFFYKSKNQKQGSKAGVKNII